MYFLPSQILTLHTTMCKLYVEVIIMATNLAINDQLLNNALEIGGFRSKKDTVNAALEEFIQRRKAEDVINLFGKIDFDENYDYKKMRSR